MSRKKISEMREDKRGIPLLIGWWPEHLKRHHQWKVDTWHLPRKAKLTRLVANTKTTRGISIYWYQLYTSKDVSVTYPICWTTHVDEGGTDGVKKKAPSPMFVHMAHLLKDQSGRGKYIWLSLTSLINSSVHGRTRFHENSSIIIIVYLDELYKGYGKHM